MSVNSVNYKQARVIYELEANPYWRLELLKKEMIIRLDSEIKIIEQIITKNPKD